MANELKPIKMHATNSVTYGQELDIARNEQLLHDAAESMMRKLYKLYGFPIPFDENPLKEQLIAKMYGNLLRGAKEAVDCNGLSNAQYYNWTHL